MFLNDINARIGELDAELEGIAGLTDPTDDDVARTEAILAERAELKTKALAAAERTQRIAEAHAAAKAEGRTISGSSFEFQRKVEPYDADFRYMDAGEQRDAARAILDRPEARHLADDQKAKADGLIGTLGPRMAHLVVSTSRPQYRSAFAKYISGNENLLTNEERMAVAETRGSTMVLADANGGYAVPALLDPSVIYTGSGTSNPMRQVSRIVTGMDDTWRGVTSAGITASWDSEQIEVSNDGPTLGQATVVSHKAAAFVPFSVEIEGDWAGLAAEMSVLFGEAKDELETTAFATGNGTSDRPYGILTDLFAASGTVGVLPTTDGQFGAVDVRAVFGSLGPRYRPNASFMSSIDVMNEVRGFDTAGGLSNQTVDLTAPYSFNVLGRPYYENSGFPDFTGTTGAANILVVGDFRNYVIFDRVGSRVEFIPHLLGSNRLPNGSRGLYFWWRVGGKTVNTNAFRILLNA
ncbi:MAG TPA: phage major capsid protein [Ilumatobacteraceae bacterium]|jgi:HK97 family phage major capsid protein